jgi:hypothetical protein
MNKNTVFLLISLFIFPSISISKPIDPKVYIPKNASQYMPLVINETSIHFKELPIPWYIPSLIEHESCVSLTHSKCWNPKSRLRTAREEGGGLGQLTRAFNKNGSIRFDSLSDMRRKHITELKELTWRILYSRPDLQVRAILLMSRDNYRQLYAVVDSRERLAMADAAYNGGLGGLNKERRACKLRANCNQNKWFGNVEKVCLKSKRILYGNRNACDINRNHVREVLNLRLIKYKAFYVKKPIIKKPTKIIGRK